MRDNGRSITLTQKKNGLKFIDSCKLKFIDSCRFMHDSLSNLVGNLSEVNTKNLEISYAASIKKFSNTY